ncbi:hypothetical protein LK07_33180 [Streptomyces pluripotens]|uniref:Uncharacterized protein n=1 Tax=Streptomyces pluripotens TaxID=1355015 RepID=A0A221P714_9ACTN|nr:MULTISPECIES: hypothetical protein [Streptomyces]ARP73812.1 hypothetical protein LK06_031985 [Streptomyces pluripotens]ASN28059.1 hypothetical protein LK07_33180 [Streptomyces pluripotens]MCH0559402.1 hypothetical protein [Streptomyces sp. MUM 16J]
MTVGNAMADRVTHEFVRRCERAERYRRTMSTTRTPPSFHAAYDVVSRPFFGGRDAMASLGLDARDPFGIVVSLPDRLFGGDLGT